MFRIGYGVFLMKNFIFWLFICIGLVFGTINLIRIINRGGDVNIEEVFPYPGGIPL